jgi:hypothetical protein
MTFSFIRFVERMEEEKMFMRHEDLMAVKISMSRGLVGSY